MITVLSFSADDNSEWKTIVGALTYKLISQFDFVSYLVYRIIYISELTRCQAIFGSIIFSKIQ